MGVGVVADMGGMWQEATHSAAPSTPASPDVKVSAMPSASAMPTSGA